MEDNNLQNQEVQRIQILADELCYEEFKYENLKQYLEVLDSEVLVDRRFYELCLKQLSKENINDLKSMSKLSALDIMARTMNSQKCKLVFSLLERFTKLAANTNSEYTQVIFNLLAEANILDIDRAIASNMNPNIEVSLLRTLARKHYEDQSQIKPLRFLVEANVKLRQKTLLQDCEKFFGTPILPIYEKVDMYEQLENFLKIAKLLYPNGIEQNDITKQEYETAANYLDPGYENSIVHDLAKLNLYFKNKSIISKGLSSLLNVIEYSDPNIRLQEHLKKLSESLIISLETVYDSNENPVCERFDIYPYEEIIVSNKLIKAEKYNEKLPEILPALKKSRDQLALFLNRLGQAASPTFEDLQFQALTGIEYAELVRFETEEQAWFDDLKTDIETKISGGMLEYLLREMSDNPNEQNSNSTEIIVSSPEIDLNKYKSQRAKDFIDGMFVIFSGKPELYKDDKFLNDQIYNFWANLNFAFETDRYDDNTKVGQLPKAYLEITILLLQKLKIRYENKKQKLLQPQKPNDEKPKSWYQKIQNLRPKSDQDKSNPNQILIDEIKKLDQMIYAISKLI